MDVTHRWPTSWLPPRALAPILTVTFGVAVLLEIAASLESGTAYAWAGMLTGPILGTTVASAFAARRMVLPTLGVAFTTIATQTLGATYLFHGQFLWQLGVAVSAAVALAGFVAMLPIFVLGGWLGRRDDADADLEAGDVLLGSTSAIFTVVNLVVAAVFDGSATKAALAGGLFGGALCMAALISGVRRRRWLAKVQRGALPGLHIRPVTDGCERALPAVVGRRELAPHVVVETLDGAVTAYRGEVPAVPRLTVPA